MPEHIAPPANIQVVAEAEPLAVAAGKRKILPSRSGIGSLLKEVKDDISVKRTDENRIELTTDVLPDLWQSFLDDIRHKAQHSFMSVAESQKPDLQAETIVFSVPNNISLEMLQLHKSEIMTYFLSKTTAKVQLEFLLVKKEESTRIYRSPKDRLKDMAAVNAAVNKLIQKFDLNLD